ncbi:hypothetical protein HOLleu_08638 [Holothuria leucospilota]|uniref:Uncharacterized protein n=1 Tax=Holothuria leucospilota TaxID=206669 RepID=A0A9Q1HH45_HOLLE|nr:hypothetical protein HOLleu_08638 [Holothuria leucospilota]
MEVRGSTSMLQLSWTQMFHKEDAASQMLLLGFGVEEMSHRMLNLLTLASVPKRAMFRILQVSESSMISLLMILFALVPRLCFPANKHVDSQNIRLFLSDPS